MTLADYIYVIVADWPQYGRQFWREGMFDTEKEATEAWQEYVKTNNATFVELRRLETRVP